LPYTQNLDKPLGLRLPFYIKPVKATYSVLARRIDTRAELKRHLAFAPYERYIIKRLVQPFNAAFDALIGQPMDYRVDAHWLIAEELMQGHQLNLDGYVYRGDVRLVGCVDEVMYPGTDAFLRFQYPSKLPPAVQKRAHALAARVVRGLGFDHGFFNIEFFYEPQTDQLKVIEVNPRLASQLADLYEKVDGVRIFDMLVELALGRDPAVLARRTPTAAVAASFVWRTFDGAAPPQKATPAAREWLRRTYPDALLLEHHKHGHGLKREFKWLGSHRYATVNLGAPSEAALGDRYRAICERLGWPAAA
jgi:Carbamoyl-phosphate synthase L chain, ATP binding domain